MLLSHVHAPSNAGELGGPVQVLRDSILIGHKRILEEQALHTGEILKFT